MTSILHRRFVEALFPNRTMIPVNKFTQKTCGVLQMNQQDFREVFHEFEKEKVFRRDKFRGVLYLNKGGEDQ